MNQKLLSLLYTASIHRLKNILPAIYMAKFFFSFPYSLNFFAKLNIYVCHGQAYIYKISRKGKNKTPPYWRSIITDVTLHNTIILS